MGASGMRCRVAAAAPAIPACADRARGAPVNQFSGDRHGDPVWLNGETVLEHYQLKNYSDRSSARYTWYKKDVEMWANVGFLCIFFVGYFVFAWAGLKYAQHGAR